MRRVAEVLSSMGALIKTANNGSLPLTVYGDKLHANNISLPVASAQMKSAVLLAALFANGTTRLREPLQSRDHTERMMDALGFGILVDEGMIKLDPELEEEIAEEIEYIVPGDISSAAFLAVAAILLHQDIVIRNVSLNPTRSRFLDILSLMGVELESTNVIETFAEPRGDLVIYGSQAPEALVPFNIANEEIPLLMDEIPALLLLALFADGTSVVRSAAELRIKESDRLHSIAEQFQAFGAEVEEFEDGIAVIGVPGRILQHAIIDHKEDHRLAMIFAIASLFCTEETTLSHSEIVGVSYPDFFEHLQRLSAGVRIQAK
jgi:3-phosphoshikimate 1-carboxyvinyltransferase